MTPEFGSSLIRDVPTLTQLFVDHCHRFLEVLFKYIIKCIVTFEDNGCRFGESSSLLIFYIEYFDNSETSMLILGTVC